MAEARSKAERGRAPLGTANASSKASTSADIPSAEQGLGLAELLCAHGVYSQPRGFSLCQVLKEGPFVRRPRNLGTLNTPYSYCALLWTLSDRRKELAHGGRFGIILCYSEGST